MRGILESARTKERLKNFLFSSTEQLTFTQSEGETRATDGSSSGVLASTLVWEIGALREKL